MPALPIGQSQLNRCWTSRCRRSLPSAGPPRIENLHVDLVVAQQTQPIDVRRADGRPLSIDRGRLRVHHGALIQQQPYAVAEQVAVEAAGQPVSHDVVGLCRNDDPNVHTSASGSDEGGQNVLVGNEVGVGQVDVVRCAVDGIQIHAANRVDHVARHVPMDPNVRLPGSAAEVGQCGATSPRPEIPEVDERVLDVPDDVAGEPGMGVAPVGGVEAPDVVAAEEGYEVVDHQQLAVVPAGVPREPEAGRDQRMAAYRDVLGEDEEGPRDDQVGKLVEDHVDLDSAIGRIDQRVLERLTNGVALPDEALEEDPRLRLADGMQHVAIEVFAVGVDGDLGGAHGDRAGREPRERGGLAEPLASIVDHDQCE